MFDQASDDEPTIDQQIRINELRKAVREAAGGEMTEWESEECHPEVVETFWGNVLAYENAEHTCHFIQLEDAGVEMPEPDSLGDAQLSAKLWEVIDGLDRLRVYLS